MMPNCACPGLLTTTGPPGPPTAVQATATGNTLRLSWGAPVSGAAPTGYTLIARSGPGAPPLLTLPLTTSPFMAVAPNGTFHLSLTATNASGTSPESAGVSVSFPGVVVAPGPPTSLRPREPAGPWQPRPCRHQRRPQSLPRRRRRRSPRSPRCRPPRIRETTGAGNRVVAGWRSWLTSFSYACAAAHAHGWCGRATS